MSYYKAPRFPSRFPSGNKIKIAAAVITVIIIIVILAESIVIVEAGHRGVVLYLGAVENKVLGEIAFITPFVEQVVQMEVRTQKFQAEQLRHQTICKKYRAVIALNYRIDPQEANKIYQILGVNYADRVISPTIQESVKLA